MSTDHSKASLDGAHSHASGGPDAGPGAPEGSRADRLRTTVVADHPVPTGREEEWRFAALEELAPLFDDAAGDAQALDYDVMLPDSVDENEVIGTLAKGEGVRTSVLVPEDRISALANEHTDQALHVNVPANKAIDGPIIVNITGNGTQANGHGHVVVQTGESAEATVVLNHTGNARYAQNVELILGDNSNLTLIAVHDWDDEALHVSAHVAGIGRDANLKHVVVSLGGKAVRVNSTAAFTEPGGEAEKLGLYFSDASQHLEHRLFVDHAAPNCRSNVTYKGALQGEGARAVWVGDVLIRKAAEGTDTYELNRNLVLTDGARADSVPNLEIETGEIEGAGHASATGRFDDEQLFYLMSRGVSEEDARRLVVRGFFAELIKQIGVPQVEERLMEAIEAELDAHMESGLPAAASS